MKIKENEIKNITIHAHVYIIRLWGSKSLESFRKSFHVQLYLLLCCFPRVTRLKSSSLHLNTFNQLQNRCKTRFYD